MTKRRRSAAAAAAALAGLAVTAWPGVSTAATSVSPSVSDSVSPSVSASVSPSVSASVSHSVSASAKPSSSPAAPSPTSTAGLPTHVIVLGVRGARWATIDGSTAPGLSALALASALGSVSLRSAADHTCPADAWLTIGSGTRAAHPDGCRAVVTVSAAAASGGAVAGFPDLAARVATGPYAARAGTLADSIRATGGCVTAVGVLAALGAAHPDGSLDRYVPDPASVTAEELKACPVTLVDVPGLPAGDAVVRHVLETVVGDPTLGTGARVLAVGTGDGTDRLAAAAFLGGGFAPGLLAAPEVGRPPYIQLVDVPATVLSFLTRAVPAGFLGRPVSLVAGSPTFSDRLGSVRAAATASETRARDFTPFVSLLVGLQAAGWALLWLLWRRRAVEHGPVDDGARIGRSVDRRRLAVAAAGLGLAGLAAPAASFVASLTRWPTSILPLPILCGATLAASAGLAAAAARSRDRGFLTPVAVVCTVSALIIAFDLVFGSRLQFNGALGYDAVTAGRFHGLGNLSSGVFSAVGLVALALVAQRQPPRRRSVVAIAGAVALVAVIGTPAWGADVGGVIAAIPALTVLVLLLAGRRASPRAVLLALVVAAAVVTALGVADAARGPQRSGHLGRFVTSLRSGGAWTTVHRRLAADADLFLHSLWSPVLLVCAGLALYLLVRPRPAVAALFAAAPELRAAAIAAAAVAAIGLVVNDSGLSVVAGVLLIVPPAIGAAAAYHWLVLDERRADAARPDAVLP
jgi:hypothetical protein